MHAAPMPDIGVPACTAFSLSRSQPALFCAILLNARFRVYDLQNECTCLESILSFRRFMPGLIGMR